MTVVTILAYVSVGLLGLSVLTGVLALVLRATDVKKVTLRAWLGLGWLATLITPALALGIFMFGYAVLHSVNDARGTSVYSLDPARLSALMIAVPLATLLITMGAIAWLTGHTVLRPLAAMRQAARQVASGDLDVTLPASSVREVAEVAAAFTAMGGGLRTSLERQAEIEQERRLFVSAIAHDLRTPLFSLRGYLEGLGAGVADTPERRAHYVAICREQADRLEQLVAGLFAYARLEYLDDAPRREPVALVALLSSAVESMRPQADTKRISLALDAANVEERLEGDAHLLTRAVENLLDNALRHTPAAGCIRVCAWREGSRCLFSITDSGPGIPSHDLPHIFDPAYRGDASRNQRTGGAGLGLTIARRILHAHGGDVVAANGEHGGAIFTAWIPTRPTSRGSYSAPSMMVLTSSQDTRS